MLDKPQIGVPNKVPPLKCEECGLLYEIDNSNDDFESIDEFGLCVDCYSSLCRHQSEYCDGFNKVE